MPKLTSVNRQRLLDLCRKWHPQWRRIQIEMRREYRITVSERTCSRTWARWVETRSTKDRGRCGRPSKCTSKQERAICNFAKRNRFALLRECAEFATTNLQVYLTAECGDYPEKAWAFQSGSHSKTIDTPARPG